MVVYRGHPSSVEESRINRILITKRTFEFLIIFTVNVFSHCILLHGL